MFSSSLLAATQHTLLPQVTAGDGETFLFQGWMRCWGGRENTSEEQSSQGWRASPSPCFYCCNAVGSAAWLEGTRAGDRSSSGKTPPTPRHCLFPELLQHCLDGKVGGSGISSCSRCFSLLCPPVPRLTGPCRKVWNSGGARLASASHAAGKEDVQRSPFALKHMLVST